MIILVSWLPILCGLMAHWNWNLMSAPIFSHMKANAILIDHMFDLQLIIEKHYFQPSLKSKFSINLCHLLSVYLVWPTLILDVLNLE